MSLVTTLLHVNNGGVVKTGIENLGPAITRESVNVANASGANVRFGDVRRILEACWKDHNEHTSLMLNDYLHGCITDIDCLNGEIVRRAVRWGSSAPLNATLIELVRAQSRTQELSCEIECEA